MPTEDGPQEGRRDRAEEAFEAMTSAPEAKAGEPAAEAGPGANPWKVATFVLLALALALPLAFALRTSRVELDREHGIEQAREELLAVRELMEDGQLGEAVVALHDAGMRVQAVPGAEEAAFELKETVEARIAGLAAEVAAARAEIRGLDRRAEVRGQALRAILEGRVERAGELLAGLDDDPEGAALATLVGNLAALDRAERTGESARADALAEAAAAWPLSGLRSVAQRAAADVAARKRLGTGLRSARSAVSRGEAEAARRGLGEALSAARVGPVEDIVQGFLSLERGARAGKLAAAGEAAPAAALYRTLALEGDDTEAAERADALEKRLERERLELALLHLAERAVMEKDFAAAAEFHAALGRLSEDPGPERRVRILRGKAFRVMAEEARSAGDLRAAGVFAAAAVRLGDEGAKDLLGEIERIFSRLEAERTVARAEAALADGAAAHARALLEGTSAKAPRDLLRRIEARERREALESARAALDRGAAREALAFLQDVGLADSLVAAPLRARALLLAGEIDAGLALLPEDPETRAMALVRVALALLPTDPAAAAARLGRAREIAGDRPDLTAALAFALEAADPDADTAGLWREVRDAALQRAPLPMPAEER